MAMHETRKPVRKKSTQPSVVEQPDNGTPMDQPAVAQDQPKISVMAIVALVLSVFGILLVPAILGLILAALALRQIDRSGQAHSPEEGMSNAQKYLSFAALFLFLLSCLLAPWHGQLEYEGGTYTTTTYSPLFATPAKELELIIPAKEPVRTGRFLSFQLMGLTLFFEWLALGVLYGGLFILLKGKPSGVLATGVQQPRLVGRELAVSALVISTVLLICSLILLGGISALAAATITMTSSIADLFNWFAGLFG